MLLAWTWKQPASRLVSFKHCNKLKFQLRATSAFTSSCCSMPKGSLTSYPQLQSLDDSVCNVNESQPCLASLLTGTFADHRFWSHPFCSNSQNSVCRRNGAIFFRWRRTAVIFGCLCLIFLWCSYARVRLTPIKISIMLYLSLQNKVKTVTGEMRRLEAQTVISSCPEAEKTPTVRTKDRSMPITLLWHARLHWCSWHMADCITSLYGEPSLRQQVMTAHGVNCLEEWTWLRETLHEAWHSHQWH